MKNKKRLMLCCFGILCFVILGTQNVWQSFKFIVFSTAVAYGNNLSYYRTGTRRNVRYEYWVDNRNYKGDASVHLFLNRNEQKHSKIRYLINKPDCSIVDSFILRETITNLIILLMFLMLFCWAILVFLGKLPDRYQKHFNKVMKE